MTEALNTSKALRALGLKKRDLMCALRAVFKDGITRRRKAAMREIAEELDLNLRRPEVAVAACCAINAGVRRNVIKRGPRGLSIDCRSINDYSRHGLILALRSVQGRWTARDEAIRLAARYYGFQRTGATIQQALKAAINGGLRRGLLEKDGHYIRAVRL